MSSIIDANAPYVVLINMFTVTPERQEELVAALSKSTDETFTKIPGFVSANFHVSLDGTKVVNYAQWESEQAFVDMQKRPEIQAHMAELTAMAEKVEPRLYRVNSTHAPQS
jgi:heme-degrading monooxygenase HmoA